MVRTATVPESEESDPERVLTVVVRAARAPDTVARVVLVATILPERVLKFDITVPERVLTVLVRVERDPEIVLMVVLRVFNVHESAKILAVFCVMLVVFVAVCPERVLRFPESVLTVLVRVESDPESDAILALIPATVPERAFCARRSVK